MRRTGLLIGAVLAFGGAGPVQAAGAAAVTLPLKLGGYVDSAGHCSDDGQGGYQAESYIILDKKGFFDGPEGGAATFAAVTSVGPNRYRIRFSGVDPEDNHHYSLSEVWKVHSATSFTIETTAFALAETYHYCGPKHHGSTASASG